MSLIQIPGDRDLGFSFLNFSSGWAASLLLMSIAGQRWVAPALVVVLAIGAGTWVWRSWSERRRWRAYRRLI